MRFKNFKQKENRIKSFFIISCRKGFFQPFFLHPFLSSYMAQSQTSVHFRHRSIPSQLLLRHRDHSLLLLLLFLLLRLISTDFAGRSEPRCGQTPTGHSAHGQTRRALPVRPSRLLFENLLLLRPLRLLNDILRLASLQIRRLPLLDVTRQTHPALRLHQRRTRPAVLTAIRRRPLLIEAEASTSSVSV